MHIRLVWMKTPQHDLFCRHTDVLSLLVVNHITYSTLALPFLVTEPRVASSGETRVCSIVPNKLHFANNVYVLHLC